MLLQAQENILALNGSRIRALQELKAANEKIAELEKRLDEAAKQLSSFVGHRPQITEQEQEQLSNRNPALKTPPSVPVYQVTPAATITVCYTTGWEDCYLHFQVDDQRKFIFIFIPF